MPFQVVYYLRDPVSGQRDYVLSRHPDIESAEAALRKAQARGLNAHIALISELTDETEQGM
jgi:hypothetical protein